ncbi:M24 family metallopeptidase [Mycobacterium sp. NPDC003449]
MTTVETAAGRPDTLTNDERVGRLNRFAGLLRTRQIDAAIIDSADNMRYLFGYSATAVMYQCCIVTADGTVRAVVRKIDEPVFSATSWVEDRVTYSDWDDPFDVLIAEIRQMGLAQATIAQELDSNYLSVRDYQRIVAGLPRARFADVSGVVLQMRAQKSASEIEDHRRSAAIADVAMAATVSALAEGVSERELVGAGYEAALRAGADNNAPRIVLLGMGSKSTHFHGGVGDHRLEVGEPVHIELLPQSNGYSSRLMRPALLGDVPSRLQSDFDQLAHIQDLQFQSVRPGLAAKAVDRIGREELARAGIRPSFTHNTGYGLGIITGPKLADFAHLFTPVADWEVLPNMVFHMYLSASGISISETVRVTEDGIELLTRTPRSIQLGRP